MKNGKTMWNSIVDELENKRIDERKSDWRDRRFPFPVRHAMASLAMQMHTAIETALPGRDFAEIAAVQQPQLGEENGTGKRDGVQLFEEQLHLKFVAFLLQHERHGRIEIVQFESFSFGHTTTLDDTGSFRQLLKTGRRNQLVW